MRSFERRHKKAMRDTVLGMDDGWYERLLVVIDRLKEQHGGSSSAVAESLGLGRNYFTQMERTNRKPRSETLLKILSKMPSTDATFVLLNVNLSKEDLDFLRKFHGLPNSAQNRISGLISDLSNVQSPQEPELSDQR